MKAIAKVLLCQVRLCHMAQQHLKAISISDVLRQTHRGSHQISKLLLYESDRGTHAIHSLCCASTWIMDNERG